ncbi:hypothetical protein ACHQM5_017309 [Ranunculus cassubicifolius]
MAKSYSELLGLMEILQESIKLLRKNKKILFFIVLYTMISYSILTVANTLSLLLFIRNLAVVMVPVFATHTFDPKSPEFIKQLSVIKDNLVLLFLTQLFFVLLMSLVSLFSVVSTIYVSAMSYLGKDLTLKDLYLKIKLIWSRPIITWFYFSLLSGGFIVMILPLSFLLSSESIISVAIGIVIIILAIGINAYFSLLWMLSLVSSVLEDCSGFQALGKAEKLVQGRKIVGLFLTFIVMMLFSAVVFPSMVNSRNQAVFVRILMILVTLGLGILVKIMSMTVYTVFYFDRKHSCGEQVEVEDSVEYSRVSAVSLVESAIP